MFKERDFIVYTSVLLLTKELFHVCKQGTYNQYVIYKFIIQLHHCDMSRLYCCVCVCVCIHLLIFLSSFKHLAWWNEINRGFESSPDITSCPPFVLLLKMLWEVFFKKDEQHSCVFYQATSTIILPFIFVARWFVVPVSLFPQKTG